MNLTSLDALDEQLLRLAVAAQQAPSHPDRRVALRQLVNAILQSGRLCRPRRGQFVGSYDDIYDEAVQDLMLFVCQNIGKYNPDRGGVMGWVNMLLERRFFREAIPKVLNDQRVQRVTLADLDNVAIAEETDSLVSALEDYVESDPNNLLKKTFVRNCPAANVQVLMQRRMAGATWESIAREFGVSSSTLSSFYYRSLEKFSATLKAYCTGDRPSSAGP